MNGLSLPGNEEQASVEPQTDNGRVAGSSGVLEPKDKTPEQVSDNARKDSPYPPETEQRNEHMESAKGGDTLADETTDTRDSDEEREDVSDIIGHEFRQRIDTSKKRPGKPPVKVYRQETLPSGIRQFLEKDLNKNQESFVVPEGFAKEEGYPAEHMVILRGEEGSGKYAAAQYLAYQLLNKNLVERAYRVPNDLGMNLCSLVSRYPRSLLIVRDALFTENSPILRSIKGVESQSVGTTAERKALRELLVRCFSEAELQDLCFDVDVDYESLGGEGKADNARRLIEHCGRHNRIAELITAGRGNRQDINWGNSPEFIAQLRKRLQESSAYLVLTVADNNLGSTLSKMVEQVLDLISMQGVPVHRYQSPDPYLVLERHLQVASGEKDTAILLEKRRADGEAELDKDCQPRDAVDLAHHLLSDKDGEISSGVDIASEVESFFKSLDDDGRLLALNLSLLEPWRESDFWHMHGLLTPTLPNAPARATSKKRKKKKKEKKRQPTSEVFGTPKSELLDKIRAQSVLRPVRIGRSEELIQHIEFIDEGYADRIQDYIERNHPDFLEQMIPHLAELAVEAEDKRSVRIATARAIGLMSRGTWPYVQSLINEWAKDSTHYVQAMVGHVLSQAYKDPETRTYTTHILKRWTNSSNPKWQWTAASTYKEMRWVDLDFALDGLEQMAYRLNLSPQKVILPYESHLIASLNKDQFEEYILRQAGATSRRTNPAKVMAQVEAYLKRVDEAEAAWARIEPVYDAIEFAIIVIAFDFLKDTIDLLCDWVNEEERTTNHTIQLTGSLIWLRLANVMADVAHEEKSSNSILELVAQDEEALEALAELFGGSLVQLFPLQLADYRKSFEICLVLEEWARATEHSDAVRKLIDKMNLHLSNHPRVLKYVERWQSMRMPENIGSLAQATIEK